MEGSQPPPGLQQRPCAAALSAKTNAESETIAMHVVNKIEQVASQQRASTALLARLSEAPVLKRARARDVTAFEDLVRRTEERMYRLAMRYVHNEDDAQEILQNAYLAAWRCLPTFEGRAQFSCWMHRITVNASLMVLRARGRHREVAFSDVAPAELNAAMGTATHRATLREAGSPRPDHEFQSVELRGRIANAVSLLPLNLRAMFFLREIKEMSTKDAADELGVTIPAAKTRLFRARKALRESLVNYVEC
jgi:RNA polymerase sigma-70 factor, ECF subfamily